MGRERGGFLGRGSQLEGLGSVVNSPSVGSGARRFSCILEAPDGISWNLLEPCKFGGMAPLGPPF